MALHFALLDARLHQRSSFASGVTALDSYLQQRASQHQRDGIATTHVLIDSDNPARILGYCTLSAAQLTLSALQEADRKGLPAYPVPAMRVGRLAVAAAEQGKGYGQLLLGHAVNLALSLRQTLGVRVLVVDAKDTPAALFYQRYGFTQTSENALTLYLPLGRV
ncbi:MAG: GNAT family N-acetyltransferase [Giesbergeria sp.]|uniref:GNAT family N-acetyltransferase n=1 Tax=Giesbergeria sp. TaxID=2818473 RepID=UPI0026055AF8|nr:GNAT family N-acetyltransferase [Giesbergeria sp.]MDD2608355.1 GNAT family N-acetyltransferase [Giesbergeria sp.]